MTATDSVNHEGVAGETPKMGRRYWYQTFSDAMADIMEQLEPVAEAQGAESVAVVWRNYHSETERRNRRRRAMRSRLAEVFDDVEAKNVR